jgi:hypothetical protein
MKSTFVALALASFLVLSIAGAPIASGDGVNGPTTTGPVCMQKTFGTPVTNANKLNCTANDIRLSRAIYVSPSSCIKGTTFDLTATFETVVTANSRYDAGFFFRLDGGSSARGDGTDATGTCSLSALKPPPPANSPALQLDGDSCGDLNSGTYQVTFVIPGVVCEAAPNSNQLKLPNCTSWHSNSSTSCQVSDPFVNGDAPYFHPDTKSKCVCDDTFTVPVTVEDATISVLKTAVPDQISEPGGTVTYTVQATNDAQVEPVTIYSIIDNPYGNLGTNAPGYSDNTCPSIIGTVLAKGDSASCYFKVEIKGNAGDVDKDTVKVTAYQPSTGKYIDDSHDATVTIINAADERPPTLTKTSQSAACQVDVNYQVVVNNNSPFDTLSVTSLNDDKFGDITSAHDAAAGIEQVVSTTCKLPATAIVPKGNFTCSFVGRVVSATCDIDHKDVVKGEMIDDDGVVWDASGDAVVSVTATVDTSAP